jgi:murein tripeptide amidase MpaA
LNLLLNCYCECYFYVKELRDKFIFKIVPMLNPDGVIIGNYRCDLSGRDLNRNYRHPRSDNFPTVWHTKVMVEQLIRTHGVVLYCDLHGHSRKQNVFMYGCPRKDILLRGTNENNETVPQHSEEECFLHDRLFPWLMAKRVCNLHV